MMLFSAATAARIKAIRQDGFDTIRMFHDDVFEAWRTVRSADWGTTTTPEADELCCSGTGRLYENGPGGPVSGENVIHVESPYRFRTASEMVDPDNPGQMVEVPVEPGHELVINGDRLFRVESVKREDRDDRLMNVYLTELLNTPLPEEVGPDPGEED